jgi:PAS domain S-box-containing protein
MESKPTYDELVLKVKELETKATESLKVETSLKESEERLKLSEARSRAWLEHSPVCTKIVDLDFNLQYMSSAGVESLHVDDITQFYGKPYPFDFYPESFKKPMTCNLEKVKSTGEVITQEASVVDIDGKELWFHSTLVPVKDDEGRIEYIMVVSLDTTERKKAEDDLIEAKKSAEEANTAKSDFLANISHEIRTPITVFMSAIEHLLEIDKDPKCQEVLDLANISSKRLYVLLNEIFDHSKIESCQMDLEEETFKVRRCLNETIEMMNDRAQKKHLKLALDVSPSVPEDMLGDPYRLGQILLNLIGNGVKFTEEGGVTVKVKRHDDYLKFNVSDTGIGISEDKLEDMFESFRQVDSSSTRSHGGVGLGLTISKGLIELMGGRISVHSELGQGSVFSFTLPLKSMKK